MMARRKWSSALALGIASVMALSGAVGTGSAMAAEEPGEQCAGSEIIGQGSSLQKVAQEIWGENTVTGKGFKLSTNGSACSGTQGSGGKPVVAKYEASGSGAGRTIWGAEASGHSPWDGTGDNPAESKNVAPTEPKDGFVASDEPPTPTQMENIDLAAGEPSGQAIVIPVEQAAVAVIVNPPAECLITKITNKNLQEIWDTTITEWSGVTGGKSEGAGVTEDTAGACKVTIKRVVRKDSSGTTFVFKTYLEQIAKKTATCSGVTWETYALPAENLKWPEEPAGTCKGKVVVSTNKGGSGEAEEVEKTSGAIGYANLADARAKFTDETGDHYHWLGVQNQKEAGFYPYPGTSSGEPSLTSGESNCKKTHYSNVSSIKVGADDNWSEVNGAHTSENENYPICTLTYDIALMNYFKAEFYKLGKTATEEEEEANKSGKSVYDYMSYVVAPGGGQADIAGHDYLEVEEAVGKFAQEEALLIAEGADISVEATATGTGKIATSFNTAENLFLVLFDLESSGAFPPPVDFKFTVTAGLSWVPSLTLLSAAGGATGGLFNISKNECTKASYTVTESCLIEIEALAEGLEFLMTGKRNLVNLEVK